MRGQISKGYFLYFFFFSFLFPSFCFAQIVINEIMYDSPGADDDWVEIYNAGSESVTIVTGSVNGSWRFVDSSAHTLRPITGGNVLASGDYAVITSDASKFTMDWPSFSGKLFESSFSLTNTSNTISIKDGSGNVTDPAVSYASTQGAKGDGNSLQRSGTIWVVATPTPGTINSQTQTNASSTNDQPVSSSGSDTNSSSSFSSHYESVGVSNYKAPEKLLVTMGRNRLTTIGSPTEFEAESNIAEGRVLYSWSFGDGAMREGKRVEHVYDFPGDYIVVLNAYHADDSSVSRSTIKVIDPKLSIEEANNSFIKIKNNSKYEVNLYGWELSYGGFVFKFPVDTIILPGASIGFSSRITGLKPMNEREVTLGTSNPNLPQNQNKNITTEPKNEISTIYQKAKLIQDELSTMKEIEAPKNINQTAITLLSLTTSTTTPIKSNWFETLKRFLFKRN